MAKKLVSGFESVGHIDGLADDLSAGYLRLDDRGAVVSLPSIGSAGDMFVSFLDKEEREVPRNLRFVATDGSVFLGECRDVGGTVSSLGTSLTRIRARRAIEAGDAGVDYDEIDGMTTEIDGLSRWAEMSTVTQSWNANPWPSYSAPRTKTKSCSGVLPPRLSSRPSLSTRARRAMSSASPTLPCCGLDHRN